MPFVIDAQWFLPGHCARTIPIAAASLQQIENDEAVAPGLWWFEVRNGLIVNERRGRIIASETTRFLQRLGRLAVRVDHAPIERHLFRLARRYGLTVYDSAYLELALRERLSLATLDAALTRAARGEQVALIGDAPD